MDPVTGVIVGAIFAGSALCKWFLKKKPEEHKKIEMHSSIDQHKQPESSFTSQLPEKTIDGYIENPVLSNVEAVRKSIVHEPGIYAWYFDMVPTIVDGSKCHQVGQWTLLYIGITNSDLRRRVWQQHFNGNAEGSTLRRTLGCINKLKLYKTSSGAFTFGKEGEKHLSNWMQEHARVCWISLHDTKYNWPATPNPVNDMENYLIHKFWLPLNLDDNRWEICGKVQSLRNYCQDNAIIYDQ